MRISWHSTSLCHVAGEQAEQQRKKLTDFRMSTIKPLTPEWIYAGWLSVAQRPNMIRAGWAKCGLLQAWDEATQKRAMLAMTDPDAQFYPLFKDGVSLAPPPAVAAGETEPEHEPKTVPAAMDFTEEEVVYATVELPKLLAAASAAATQPADKGTSSADQLRDGPLAATEKEKRRSDFMSLFKQAPPAKKARKG